MLQVRINLQHSNSHLQQNNENLQHISLEQGAQLRNGRAWLGNLQQNSDELQHINVDLHQK